MDQSLNNFFRQTPDARLNNCDREQVHLSGLIQNTGGMIVLDPQSLQICGASENIDTILPETASMLLGMSLADIHAGLAAELASTDAATGIVHEVLDLTVASEDRVYDAVTHAHGNFRFLEFVPNVAPSAQLARKRMRQCSKACAQIMNAETLDDALQIGVDAVRAITGFDRVKIYRFLPDWSGAVEAESRADHMPSYLGLHFPHGDIPAQVREMMRIVPYRVIGTVSDDNVPVRTQPQSRVYLDQTWAVLRSVSSMHTAYLRNMRIGASFSCSLKTEGRLWGLIACHNGSETTIPVDSWSLVQEIGNTLMLRQEQSHRIATADMVSNLRRVENEFASELRRHGDVEEVITSMVPVLQKFLRADGFAFQYGSRLHTAGNTPPDDFIRELVHWAQQDITYNDQLQTTALHRLYAPAKAHQETACGVLVQPIIMHRVCQLVWFRGPITRNVEWAGKPDDKASPADKTAFSKGPRTSFDRWVQQHRDESLPWEPAEIESAREIFKEFLDIIASQVLLKEENESLRHFARAAAHDIKAPLRGIKFALDWMKEDDFEHQSVLANQQLASTATRRLEKLTEALLELSLLKDQEPEMTRVDLGEVLEDVCALLAGEIKMNNAEVIVGQMPTIQGSKHLLTRLFLNLVCNSIKYRKADVTPVIEVTHVPGTLCRIEVTDNGRGIEAKFAEEVFMPTKRLVNNDDVEGSGLGLSITRRIAHLHEGNISVDTSRKDGTTFIVLLPVVI